MTDKKVVSLFDVASETPDYLKGIGTVPTGNEQVTGDDLALPQLKLLQPMSPAVVEDGAPVGKFFDTVSNETFDAVYVINLRYTAEATIWMKRAAGGGMVARYDTVKEAQAAMADMTNKADVEIVETSIHDLLRLDRATGEIVTPCRYFMTGTARQTSRSWNSMIMKKSELAPRYASVWDLSVERKTNNKGTWFVPQVTWLAWADESLFNQALSIFKETDAEALPSPA